MYIAVLIIFLGFGLRVYQLGYDSFWNDEAGQALAAIQPSVKAMLAVTRSHAMAMPLDYFVSRITSQLGVDETVMRFPSVIYGVLTIALYFNLVKQLLRSDIALLMTFLLSLSVQHIYYSQEMRFYSALIFFSALANVFLLKLFKHSSFRNWMRFVFFTALGAYFHPYVLLVMINGGIYLCFAGFLEKHNLAKWRDLLTSVIVSGVFFLPGYLYFGAHQQFSYPLLLWSGLLKGIAQGLTLLSWPHPGGPNFGVWELLMSVFMVIGILTVSRYPYHKYLLGFLGGAIGQIVMIILADWMKGYWFASRQIIHLSPVVLLLVSCGIVSSVEFCAKMLSLRFNINGMKGIKVSLLLYLFLLGATVLTIMPHIHDCYAFPKGNGEQIVDVLLETYQENDLILVIPGYEVRIYCLYATLQSHSNTQIARQSFRSISWDELPDVVLQYKDRNYLIVPSNLTDDQLNFVYGQGYQLLLGSQMKWGWNRMLFVKE